MKVPLYVGLVHYPMYDKNFNIVATAVTNYDLHDISRSSKTFGVKRYFIIHHVEGQLDMIHKILAFWRSKVGRNYNSYRTEAFDIVETLPDTDAAIKAVEEAEGCHPYVVTTDARTYADTISYKDLRALGETGGRPILFAIRNRIRYDRRDDEEIRLYTRARIRSGRVQSPFRPFGSSYYSG